MKITILFHLPSSETQTTEDLRLTVQSVLDQNQSYVAEILAIKSSASLALPVHFTSKIKVIPAENISLSETLNQTINRSSGTHILYLDNYNNAITLKASALNIFLLSAKRYLKGGYFYSDYGLETADQTQEIHLLKYHPGRVRDNQDYGKVFLVNRELFRLTSGIDLAVRYNCLYDLRLKISEVAEIVHIANRSNGSLYTVKAPVSKVNVFDYLLDAKESQVEAENILTGHLKRIQAYLEPGREYQARPDAGAEYTLAASIIIPVNNRPEFIGAAIESVRRQSIRDIEVIVVVNGGFSDPTIGAVNRYQPGGDCYLPERPSVQLIIVDINNIGFCLNIGARHAKGQYYIQLDSDDRLKPDAVEKIIKIFQSDNRIGMVIGSYEVWEKLDSGKIIRMENMPVVTHDEWTEENGRNNLLRINGAGAPRSIPFSIIREIGYFGMNEEPFARNYGEDYELVLKISEHYRIGRIYEPIYEVVRHSGGTDHSIDQTTIDRNDEAKDWMRKIAIYRRQKLNA